MDIIKPTKIVEDLVEAGVYKSVQSNKSILIRSLMSGALLGIATVVAYLATIESHSTVLGALVFPVGFAMIILLGYELATGNFAIIPMAVWAKKTSFNKLVRNWTLSILGNLIGSVFFAGLFFVYITKVGKTYDLDIIEKIIAVAESKTLSYKELGYSGFLVVFVKAIICNWMVSMGVVMAYTSNSTIGKITALWLPIFTFFALGLEHCVVNMFVIPSAMLFNSSITFSDWWLWNQIPVIIGNIIGAISLTAFPFYFSYYKGEVI